MVTGPLCVPLGTYSGMGIGKDGLVPAFSLPVKRICIVEKVEDGIVYTVDGNSGDTCQENHYTVGYYEFFGYGTPAYTLPAAEQVRDFHPLDFAHAGRTAGKIPRRHCHRGFSNRKEK